MLPAPTSPHVSDVSEAQFDAAVLARSHQVPVVVDFWAAWCAPCRMLGPTLEKQVAALEGRVELAKVDVDQAQGLSARFGVRGIPAVMAFRDGEVVAEFTGARDERFVRDWLAPLAPSAAAQALAAAHDEPSLRALLGDPQVGAAAALTLAGLLLEAQRLDEVEGLLERAERAGVAGALALRGRLSFAREAAVGGGEAQARADAAAHPDAPSALWRLGHALAARGDWAGALDTLLRLVTTQRHYRDDGARKAMVAIFDQLGSAHELTRRFRRQLQVVL